MGNHAGNELSWLAGFWDADGCIGIHKQPLRRRINYAPSSSVTTTCLKTKEHIATLLKEMGVGCHVFTHQQKNPQWSIRWDVEVRGMKRNSKFLPLIIPFLITKADEARYVMEYIESRMSGNRKKPYSDSEMGLIEKIRSAKLNRGNLNEHTSDTDKAVKMCSVLQGKLVERGRNDHATSCCITVQEGVTKS